LKDYNYKKITGLAKKRSKTINKFYKSLAQRYCQAKPIVSKFVPVIVLIPLCPYSLIEFLRFIGRAMVAPRRELLRGVSAFVPLVL